MQLNVVNLYVLPTQGHLDSSFIPLSLPFCCLSFFFFITNSSGHPFGCLLGYVYVSPGWIWRWNRSIVGTQLPHGDRIALTLPPGRPAVPAPPHPRSYLVLPDMKLHPWYVCDTLSYCFNLHVPEFYWDWTFFHMINGLVSFFVNPVYIFCSFTSWHIFVYMNSYTLFFFLFK